MNTPEWHEFNGVTWTVDELEELRKIGEIISKRAEETLPLINNFLQKTPRGIHACAIGCLFLEIVDKPLKCTSDSLVSKAKKKFTVLTKPLWRDSPRQKGSHTRELNIILIITEMNDAGIDRKDIARWLIEFVEATQ